MSKRSTAEIQEELNLLGVNLEDVTETIRNEINEISDGEDYSTNSETFPITFIELAMLNKFLHTAFRKGSKYIKVDSYGEIDNIGRLSFGGSFDATEGWWFKCSFENDENDYVFQTKIFQDRQDLVTQLHISVKKGLSMVELNNIFKKIIALGFNNSEYVGKCIKVKLKDGRFKGIEIVEFNEPAAQLILSETQEKNIKHFISRVSRGSNARYLLNGEPGTGKTESIRDIIRNLTPDVTFIMPEFNTTEDLTTILEACEIFEKAVIIMDDIDLYLGSRDNGSYTRLLGEFLSFFDGVKKRRISLLASTNDKGLVDKAAERPGRFNMIIDYTYLTFEQIKRVCEIHLPEEFRIPKVYDALNGRIDGKKVNITGAFIANLAENIKEMSEDDENWSIEDTITLIDESYRGFYMSQVDKNTNKIGFNTSKNE
jgi:hypothetical protein